MIRTIALTTIAGLTLMACSAPPAQVAYGPDGRPLPQLYQINSGDSDRIQLRFLDGVNAVRQAAGAAPVALNAELTAAAATHSRDMSVQNRPWHFGSDGSSPLDRARRVGYRGELLGENISETYETELETLSAWMSAEDQRAVILNPEARDLGFSWFQEPGGKIWWTMVTGRPGSAGAVGF
ncbi:CAP domain-containing protein [Palleronia sp. LCG004]|uniref:CAP domain-containing protein n=1 Tax=Palleronia sp. LCG004 TaxID=3079304 RepID=UPI00294208DE|nr:CAP domain-containing protein [Palleronia sp. LCG004]WOI55968.1 CAP domain-containing protein [Palleronia sp. LCG004]